MDCSKMDQNAKQYFNTLPPLLQEQLMQSSAEMTTKEELESYCKNILNRDNP